jgi:hypothetical protein
MASTTESPVDRLRLLLRKALALSAAWRAEARRQEMDQDGYLTLERCADELEGIVEECEDG